MVCPDVRYILSKITQQFPDPRGKSLHWPWLLQWFAVGFPNSFMAIFRAPFFFCWVSPYSPNSAFNVGASHISQVHPPSDLEESLFEDDRQPLGSYRSRCTDEVAMVHED